jgi:precorrin-6Y C5,15-methyltransferase (decarboxylating)
VTVVGIGADGWPGLAPDARTALEQAVAVLGSERQLGLLPPVDGQLRRAWAPGFELGAELGAFVGQDVVVLATGDPFRSGIATTLVRMLGPDAVDVLPHISSVALARARLRWSAEETTVVTVVGRRHEVVLRHLAPGNRLLVLSSDATTPATIARLLVDRGYGESRLTVLGDLGSDHETRIEGTATSWAHEAPALNVVGLDLRGPVVGSWTPGLPDDAFEHDGQITKRDVRASALARLTPQPGQLLWDVGAGAGSIAIEWMRAHPTCAAVAFERDLERVERIHRNAARLGVPDLEVVGGEAPAVLHDRPAPDAVFVGGGATSPGLLDLCRERLAAGGRLVAHAVTLETERLLAAAQAEVGGELTRLVIEHATPIGTFTGWTPARPVVQWSWSKPIAPSDPPGPV